MNMRERSCARVLTNGSLVQMRSHRLSLAPFRMHRRRVVKMNSDASVAAVPAFRDAEDRRSKCRSCEPSLATALPPVAMGASDQEHCAPKASLYLRKSEVKLAVYSLTQLR
jgi:hypothetical protein